MKFINAKSIKETAKAYGKQIHDKDLQVSSDFVAQINDLVHASNSYAKVATATGWKYSFRRDSDTAQESRDIEEETLQPVAVASKPSSNWLTF